MSFKDSGLYLAYMDIVNFRQFKKEIKEEIENDESKFNQLKLKVNKWGNIVYCQHDFTDAEFMGADFDKQRMVVNFANKLTQYLVNELRWGEYLELEISNFVEEDTGEETMSYGYVFDFKFNKLSIRWVLKWLGIIFGSLAGAGILGMLVYVLIKLFSTL